MGKSKMHGSHCGCFAIVDRIDCQKLIRIERWYTAVGLHECCRLVPSLRFRYESRERTRRQDIQVLYTLF
jgi:hypothetical protein